MSFWTNLTAPLRKPFDLESYRANPLAGPLVAATGKARPGDTQHPYLQQVARNVGRSVTGGDVADWTEQRFLGDQPLAAATIPFVPNTAMTAQPQVSQAQGNPALEQLLAQFLQSR